MNRESINMFASQRLVELLTKINHAIAHDLLEQIRYKGRTTLSYLDFGDSSDSISFIYSNKVYELEKEFGYNYVGKVWKEKRSESKVGKLIRLIFPDRYPINNPKGQEMPRLPIDIESFVNLYKAEREKNENYDRFSIVTGEEIVYWYNYKNYTRFVHEDTPLGKSCLRYEESARFLEMYLKNSDKVSMLILKDDEGKLRGRSIVWTLDLPEGRTYMDRIYTVNDFDVELFKDYARRNGWLHKERQTFGWNNTIVDTQNNNLYKPKDLRLQVALTNKKIKYYPYLDTLSVYNKKAGVLNNNGELLRVEGHLHLIDYQGSYVDEVDHREYVYSNYYNDDILRENAVFCQIDDDWAYEDDTVYVHNTDGLRALKTSQNIVCSNILTKTKYFRKEDAVFSNYLNTYIYKDSVREAYIDPEKTQKVTIHFKMIGKTFIKDENGDIIKGEPKKEDKPLKKKYEAKKKISDLDSLFATPGSVYGTFGSTNRRIERAPRPIDDDEIDFNDSDGPNFDVNGEEEGTGEGRPLPRSRRRQPSNHGNLSGSRRLTIDPNMFITASTRSNMGGDVQDDVPSVNDEVIMGRPVSEDTITVNYRTGEIIYDTPNEQLSPSQIQRNQSLGRGNRATRLSSSTSNEQPSLSSQPSSSTTPNDPTENIDLNPSRGWMDTANLGANIWDNINVLPGGNRYYDIEDLYNRMIRTSGIPMGYITGVQNPNTTDSTQESPNVQAHDESLDNSDIGDNYYMEHRESDVADLDELDLI